MWKADQWKDYEVLDTSDGEKLCLLYTSPSPRD